MDYSNIDIRPGQSSPKKTRFALDDLEKQDPNRHDDLDSFRPPPSPLISRKSTVFLDGLRGLAALSVFSQHFFGGDEHFHGFGENGHYYFITLPFVRVFWSGGAAAVAIFFVLSGYVLSQTPVRLFYNGQRQHCRKSLISAVVRRPFRLYLPCLGVTFVIVFLMHLPFNFWPEMMWSKAQPSLWAEIAHWARESISYFNPFQAHSWATVKFSYDIMIWTIPLELKGSMLVYIVTAVCCFGLSSPLWATSFLFFLVVVCLQTAWWTGGCFLGGLLLTIIDINNLGSLVLPRNLSRTATQAITVFIFLIGYYLLSQPAADGHPDWSRDTPGWYFLTSLIPANYTDDSYYRFWHSYGAILFIYGCLRLSWIQFFFSTRPLRYLGKVSYMLYVVHFPLMLVINDRIRRAFGMTFISEPKWWDNILYVPDVGPMGLTLRHIVNWAAMLAVTLSIAHAATRFIDEPSVRFAKRLAQKLGLN
ncbi:hypothetical protein R6Q59_009843 [Mikania micrantha]